MIDRSRDCGDGMRNFTPRRRAFKAARIFLGDESRAQLAGAPAWMLHDRGKKRDIVADTLDGEGVKRLRLCVDRLKPRCGVGDELGNHRVVVERNLAALSYAGVVAYRNAIANLLRRRAVAHQTADRWRKIAIRILGINPRLHRPA